MPHHCSADQHGPSTPGASKRDHRGKKVLLLAVSLVAALLAAEGIFRLLPRHWVPELAGMEFHLQHLARPSDNPRLYYELIPDNAEAEVNADGYRGPRYPREKPPGVLRIVGIGDSNMYAWQLPERDGYLRQLERLWNEEGDKGTRGQGDKGSGTSKRSASSKSPLPLVPPSPPPSSSLPGTPPPTLEVINLAVPGYNSGEHLEVLRDRALQYDPDLIILGYDHNDAEPIAANRQRTYFMPNDYGDNPLRSQLIRWLVRKRRVLQWQRALGDPDAAGNEKVDIYFARGPLWDLHFGHIEEMAAALVAAPRAEPLATGSPIPVLVFIHDAWIKSDPRHRSIHFQALHKPLLTQFAKLGWHVVDGYDLFQDYMAREKQRDLTSLWISTYPKDGHPNRRAHRMIAQALCDAILRNKLLPTSSDAQ